MRLRNQLWLTAVKIFKAAIHVPRSIGKGWLEVADRCNDNERPLSSKVHGADVLKKLPKLGFRRRAHGSIRVQEGQPALRIF